MPSPHGARIGVATCSAFPELDDDGPALLAALDAEGVDATVAVWDDPAVEWGGFDGVLVRSTWDYPLRRDAFVAWTEACRRTANPSGVLSWNTDKRYLDDLSAAGVPTVPTVFVEPGSSVFERCQRFSDYVIKPAVSGSAADCGRFDDLEDPWAQELVAKLHAQGRTVMVQPYLPGIDTQGETSVVFLSSVYSHAMRREPLLRDAGVRDAVVVEEVLETVRPVEPDAAQLALAEAALDAVPGGRERLSYARVDLIPGPDGPVLLELELTDCYLFLSRAAPDARAGFAAHVRLSLGLS